MDALSREFQFKRDLYNLCRYNASMPVVGQVQQAKSARPTPVSTGVPAQKIHGKRVWCRIFEDLNETAASCTMWTHYNESCSNKI